MPANQLRRELLEKVITTEIRRGWYAPRRELIRAFTGRTTETGKAGERGSFRS